MFIERKCIQEFVSKYIFAINITVSVGRMCSKRYSLNLTLVIYFYSVQLYIIKHFFFYKYL